MLAYYVEWHMRQVWSELLFADEDQAAKLMREPVAPAKRSDAAMKKVLGLSLEDGSPAHSFQTLMAQLQTIVRNTCRTPKSAADAPTFQITTTPSDKQKRALELISQIEMQSERGTEPLCLCCRVHDLHSISAATLCLVESMVCAVDECVC